MQRLARHSLPVVVLAGILLFLPSLAGGFLADDVYHLAVLERFERLDDVGPLSLYTFEEGKPDRMGPVQGSLAPWWASENYRQNFFRPLSSLIHLADHRLYGRNPVGYHATSLLLWGLLLAMVVFLYRELARDSGQSPVTVLLAGLLFALDDAHAVNVAWVAHRYALVGTAFTLAAFLLYHRYRRDGGRRALAGALSLFALGLLSDEGAVGLVPFVAAYELCLRQEPLSRRALSAAPILALALAYLVFYNLAGYGCAGSENYIDPLKNHSRFLLEGVLQRTPFLIAGALTPLPAELSLAQVIGAERWPVLAAWGVAGAVALLFSPFLRRNPLAGFMALAALLSMLTRTTSFAHNRLLLLPTVGTAWLLAAYVTDAMTNRPASSLAAWFHRIVAVAILGLHGLAAPVQALAATGDLKKDARKARTAALESEMPGIEEAQGARVVMIAGPASAVFMAGLRWVEGVPYPEAVWMVAAGKGDFFFNRSGEASFSLRLLSGEFLGGIGARNCVEKFVFEQGSRYRRGAMEVEITEAAGGRIREVKVAIDLPLDSLDVWLLGWDGSRFVRRRVPPWGSTGGS